MPRRVPPYGPVIRYLRRRERMSEAELGQRIGESDFYVGYLENGYRAPRAHQLERLADVFGWDVFELALLADLPIPYPDWPRLEDLDGWRELGRRWSRVVDAIARYTLARELLAQPAWQAELDDALPADAASFGIVACYGWLREHWQPYVPHPTRFEAPAGARDVRAALSASASSEPGVQEPDFLRGLTDPERAAVEAVAASLRAQRSS